MVILKMIGYIIFSIIYHYLLNFLVVLYMASSVSDGEFFLSYMPFFYFFGYLLLFALPIFFLKKTTVIFLTAFVALVFLINNFIFFQSYRNEILGLRAIFPPVFSYVVILSYLIFGNKKITALGLVLIICFLMSTTYNSFKKSHYSSSRSICLYQELEVEVLKAFSKKNRLNYTVNDKGNCFQYSYTDRSITRKIDKIEEHISNLKPLLGRVDSWGSKNREKLRFLKKHGVDARIIRIGGVDFVIWHREDVADAERLLEYSERKKESNRRLRKYKGNIIESNHFPLSSYGQSAMNDSRNSKAVYDATDRLGYLRYERSIMPSRQANLIKAWQFKKVEANNWSDEVLNSDLFRIILAEVLYKHDPDNKHEYYSYIISMLENDHQIERSYAALSLGYIGTDRDIDALANILLNDYEIPALKAGSGLIAMKTPKATEKLETTLEALSQKSDSASLKIYTTVKSRLEMWKNRGEPDEYE